MQARCIPSFLPPLAFTTTWTQAGCRVISPFGDRRLARLPAHIPPCYVILRRTLPNDANHRQLEMISKPICRHLIPCLARPYLLAARQGKTYFHFLSSLPKLLPTSSSSSSSQEDHGPCSHATLFLAATRAQHQTISESSYSVVCIHSLYGSLIFSSIALPSKPK
ncbi:hypothetical protein K505DRAFT_89324 [Melanomma pulvis-pyrius CBS 109.77]|uniref:Uncharacterized protein n=1 Tax=Melanomma pulvis-pyrius CBS 109.77 TaxID=1314802 RepID=A0A6A6X0C3_9PLEO|nr:hypothetical protein K505DRAFT_89324 [Melanomma pulvis-pyrius CBS 109.77]